MLKKNIFCSFCKEENLHYLTQTKTLYMIHHNPIYIMRFSYNCLSCNRENFDLVTEYNNISLATDETRTRLGLIQREDFKALRIKANLTYAEIAKRLHMQVEQVLEFEIANVFSGMDKL